MTYEPPPVREELSAFVELGTDLALHWRQDIYRGKVVDFCIQVLVVDISTGETSLAFKVDTRHGELHHHSYGPEGERKRTVLAVIPDRGWDFVNAAWSEWLDRTLDNAEQYKKAWSG